MNREDEKTPAVVAANNPIMEENLSMPSEEIEINQNPSYRSKGGRKSGYSASNSLGDSSSIFNSI